MMEKYFEKVPKRADTINWTADKDNMVILEVENKGFFNTLAQKLFKKPPVTYVHLDKTGSFLWQEIDGEKNIQSLGQLLEERFGEESHPLYERLIKYFSILESYNFIVWIKP